MIRGITPGGLSLRGLRWRWKSTWLRPARHLIVSAATLPVLPDSSSRHFSGTVASHLPSPFSSPAQVASLVGSCPGCGALAQIVEQGQAGHYSLKRKAVLSYVALNNTPGLNSVGDAAPTFVEGIFEGPMVVKEPTAGSAAQSKKQVASDLIADSSSVSAATRECTSAETPLCDRCHELLHHHTGTSIAHPSIESVHDTIAESRFKHNHIYHVIDAADFPMSLIPNVHKELEASLQRSHNRRAKQAGYKHGKKTEISFIITRSDLLAPKKEQVDRLMNYLIGVLRRALGQYAESVRLGNVRCVSAKRGWWTKEIKQDIWDRGDAGWLVGKVNVGKSNLYEVVFPKGRAEDINIQGIRSRAQRVQKEQDPYEEDTELDLDVNEDNNVLLPSARPETPFPVMPTISSLPGTTASPIRIPFGNGKGELIDLPGLDRNSIETFVQLEHRESLIMKSRAVPEQYSIKSGRSLLLADLIRITPLDPDMVILAYPFVPLKPHITSNEKAIAMQAGTKETATGQSTGLSTVLNEKGRESIRSAGRFKLRWDVTKQRAGPLTTRSGVGLKPSVLPFQVLSTDILIEGIGWVELVAQVRRRAARTNPENPFDEHDGYPEIEVFSPKGQYVGSREPMGAWLLNASSTKPGHKASAGRPRRSMASSKRQRTASPA